MLKEKLLEDLKNAMKEKDEITKNTVQMVRAAILQVEKDQGVTLDDNKILEIIVKESKKRKESLDDYRRGGREDIVNQVEKEIDVLAKYLPKQLSREEIKAIVEEIIKKTGATSQKEMGIVMKQAKEQMGASADGRVINEVARELLG